MCNFFQQHQIENRPRISIAVTFFSAATKPASSSNNISFLTLQPTLRSVELNECYSSIAQLGIPYHLCVLVFKIIFFACLTLNPLAFSQIMFSFSQCYAFCTAFFCNFADWKVFLVLSGKHLCYRIEPDTAFRVIRYYF